MSFRIAVREKGRSAPSSLFLVFGGFVASLAVRRTSNVCPSCQTKGSSAAGKWLVSPDCAGHRPRPSALRDARVANGFAGWGGSGRRFAVIFVAHWMRRPEAVVGAYTSRRDSMLARKDIFAVCPWMAELR